METVTDFLFLGSKITVDNKWSHEIKRYLLLGRKVIINLDSVLKGRDITLSTKVCIIKAMVFPVVMYGCEKWKWKSVMSYSLRPHGLYSPWNSPGQNTGVGSHSLLQRIVPMQGSNPGLLHCRQILYQLNHQGSPRILEWVAYPFSRGSSRPRRQPGSPALQADSLPAKLSGKPPGCESWAIKKLLLLLSRFSHVQLCATP